MAFLSTTAFIPILKKSLQNGHFLAFFGIHAQGQKDTKKPVRLLFKRLRGLLKLGAVLGFEPKKPRINKGIPKLVAN